MRKLFAFSALATAGAIAVYSPPGNHQESDTVVATVDDEMVVIGNGNPEDPCTVEINASVEHKLAEMGIHEWMAACENALAQNAKGP